MDRAPSYSSRQAAPRSPPPNLPPWENRAVSRVPYIEPSSPAPHTRRPSYSTRSNSQSYPRPARPSTTSPSPEPLSDCQSHPSTRSNARRPSHPSNFPYQTQGQTPQLLYYSGVASTPATEFLTPRDPPSPPSTSTSFSDSGSSTKSSSPPPEPTRRTPSQVSETTKAFPGTMSARTATSTLPSELQSMRTAPSVQAVSAPREEARAGAKPMGKRFRSAFKEMFKREPVDESQFEKIGEKHWADED